MNTWLFFSVDCMTISYSLWSFIGLQAKKQRGVNLDISSMPLLATDCHTINIILCLWLSWCFCSMFACVLQLDLSMSSTTFKEHIMCFHCNVKYAIYGNAEKSPLLLNCQVWEQSHDLLVSTGKHWLGHSVQSTIILPSHCAAENKRVVLHQLLIYMCKSNKIISLFLPRT